MPSKLPPIKPYEQRMDESIEESFNGMPPAARFFMKQEIDELRKRVAVLESMIPRQSTTCEDPECGDGYGCICYTR